MSREKKGLGVELGIVKGEQSSHFPGDGERTNSAPKFGKIFPGQGAALGTRGGGAAAPKHRRLLIEFQRHGLSVLARDVGAGRARKKCLDFFFCNVELFVECGLRNC